MALSPTSSRPSGSSPAPVACVLARDAALDVRTVGDHPIVWDALYDNPQDFNTLASIPTGLGLAFLVNGTSAMITTTAAGVWAFTYVMAFATDATWRGAVNTRFGQQIVPVSTDFTGAVIVACIVNLPTATAFDPQVSVTGQATAGTYTVGSVSLYIVRLG